MSSSCVLKVLNLSLAVLLIALHVESSSWDQWWGYNGISGPHYWGLINPRWSLCSNGKRQSPIDIVPSQLLFDPHLEDIQIAGSSLNVTVVSSGRGIRLQVYHDGPERVTISRGPFSYEYTLDHIIVHYGQDNGLGSEHSISGSSFPGEIQLYAFNSQLYSNWSESSSQPHGVAAISILIQLSNIDHPEDNEQVKQIISSIRDRPSTHKLHKLTSISIMDLLPSSTRQYITYAGSLTLPGCSENVDWVLINRPVYVSSQRMDLIRNLVNDLGNNCRPVQPLHRRCVRTNIDFKSNDKMESHNQTASCSMNKFLVSYSSMMSKDRTVQDLSTDYLSYRLATSKRT